MAFFIGQGIGLFFYALLSARFLCSRARVLKSWNVSFSKAFFISLKAFLAAYVVGSLGQLAVVCIAGVNEMLKLFCVILGLIAWWFVHTNGVVALNGAEVPITVKDARDVSTAVAIRWLTLMSVVALIGIAAAIVIPMFRG